MTISACCDARAHRRIIGRRVTLVCTKCHRACEEAPSSTVRVDRRVLERSLCLLHEDWSGVWDKPPSSDPADAWLDDIREVRRALEDALGIKAEDARR